MTPENPARLLREVRRRDFGEFLKRAWPHISGGELLEFNWHIDAIAHRLNLIENGDIRRLIVNLPPRNAKSKTVSVIWVAWMLGQDPRRNFVCVSYSNDLSGKMARDCLSIMQADWYRDLFPKTVISPKRTASLDFETTRGGGRLATSISGTLTGRGGDVIILDDVIKPEEANSETVRTAVNDWFQSTLASRLNDKRSGAILCVMQRLHEYDLPGMLLETGNWDHLSLPAIATGETRIALTRGRVHYRGDGEVLHPARESLSDLKRQKSEMGSHAFSAQYQQNPVPAVGNVIRAAWLHYYGKVDQCPSGGDVIQSWDTAIKSGERNDWSVCISACKVGRKICLIDVWRGKLEFPALVRKAISLAQEFRANTILVEDKGSGQQLIQALRSNEVTGLAFPIARTPTLDKRARVEGVSALIEGGQLLLPCDAPWLAEFKSEILAFPNGRHDDQIDALSQLLDWARPRLNEPFVDVAGPILVAPGDGQLEEGAFWNRYIDAWGG